MPINTVVINNLNLERSKFKRLDNGSEEMAINGAAQGTPTVIWNGTGAGDTGGDWDHEAQGTETAESKYSGTNGLDSGERSAGQETRFDYGENQDIAGTYDTLTFWMQPKAYPVGSNFKILFRTSGGSNPGNVLYVADYIDNFDLDIWQQVNIPIADFDLVNDVAKLVFIYASQGGQHFWFDDIELNSSGGGGPYTFRISAPSTEIYHVDSMKLIVVSGTSGWNSNSFADITSGLANGVLIRHLDTEPEEDQTLWSFTMKTNVDLFGYLRPVDDMVFSDNTQMFVFLLKPEIATVHITDKKVLDIVIRDNLSSLTKMRAFLHYGVEVIE